MKLALHNYWRSSASYRIRIALGVKNLPYEYVAVNILKREQHADGYRAKNPMAQVPTLILEDNGETYTLVQSLPIMEFLDERFPEPPILPNSPYDRARCRALAEMINSGIQPLQNLTTHSELKKLGVDIAVWTKGFIDSGLSGFAAAAEATAGKFCVGDSVTIADICLVPQLYGARRFGFDLTKFPRLLEIEERCQALPAFQNAAPDHQPDAVK
ncbi:MAG TPA: maleylacetoacetate isomerase [Kofleriaceae bacterium]